MKKDDLISVILPVYNVEKYVGQCINSILEQTYTNIEILIIDDGSTDSSGAICRGMIEEDRRLQFFSQTNQGQGSARNKGIDVSCGKYIIFIDPDDWIEPNCIEILHTKITAEKADFCENKFFFIFDDINKEMTPELFVSSNSLCGKLFCSKLLKENNLRMPELYFEDAALWPLVKIMSSKIVCVEKPLYYYRRNTGTSTLDISERVLDIPKAMLFMVQEAKRLNIYEANRDFFLDEGRKHLESALIRCRREMGIEKHRMLFLEVQNIVNNEFDGWYEKFKVERYWCFGSYNLSRIIFRLSQDYYDLLSKDLPFFFGFSSMISVMSPLGINSEINHKNIFRHSVIEKDILKSFKNIITHNTDYLVLDLLEERYDILEINGGYITKSEAILESNLDLSGMRVIKRESIECTELWQKSCLKFIELLKTKFPLKNIFIIETYLTTECIKKAEKTYFTHKNINSINKLLEGYYKFLKQNFCGIRFLSVPPEMNYTDGNAKHGTGPEYLNAKVHQRIAENLRKRINNTSDEDKVSVIMPAYNGEQFIGQAIESILDQTYDNFELIIIDDCPTDNTMQVVNRYNDDRICIIHNDKNSGIAYSRNAGISYSTGKYIAIMDDDDVSMPDRLEKTVDFLKSHSDIDMVGGRYDVINENGELLYHETFSLHNPKYIKAVLLFRNIYGSSTVLMRKDIIQKNNLKFRDYQLGMEDYRFWMEYSKVGNLSTIDDVILLYRKSSVNESQRVLTNKIDERKAVFAKLQCDSLNLSGFALSDNYLKTLTKVVAEFGGKCDSWNELTDFYSALQEIIIQAKNKKIDYLEELEIYLKKVYLEGSARTNSNVFWSKENI